MARTSKRYVEKKDTQVQKVFYKAGIYTRLSSERKEEWREKSSSIETQVLCCKEYALKENIKVVQTYIDYEYSGTNFERPQFQEMMQDIRDRKINCIIIRDLSRLGREYLEMGRLIDKVFPFLGVRFISVNDKLDTIKDVDSKKSFEVTLKNIVNDMYAKDISVKTKTSKHNKARNGYFIGSVPPFGYKVVKLKEGQKLEIDENVRFIVEEMFRLTLEGKSQYEVAKYFNEKGYATGKELYRRTRIYGTNHDRLYYSFQNDTCTGRIDNEKKVFIMEKDLDKAISDKVAECITKATSKSKFIKRVSTRFDESINALTKDISKLEAKLEKEELLIQKAYEEYSLGKIDKDTYMLKREIAMGHISTINNEIVSIDSETKELEKENRKSIKWINDLFKSKNIEKLSSDLIHSLVEKVIVYGNHNFEIIFKFDIETLMGGALNE